MGDPSKNLFLSEVLNVIRRENLLEEVTRSGKALLNGLYELQVLQPPPLFILELHLFTLPNLGDPDQLSVNKSAQNAAHACQK